MVVSLVGRAGSGKTQVALALALSEPYAAVLWIDASPYALEASVRRACNALGLKVLFPHPSFASGLRVEG